MNYLSPIALKSNMRTVALIPLKKQPKDVRVVIKNEDGKLLYEGLGKSFISVPLNQKKIEVYYEDVFTKQVIDKEIHDLSCYEASNEVENENKTVLDSLRKKVKDFMDNPAGTYEEQDFHTDMLNKTTTDESARHYVETKIMQVVSKESELTEEEVIFYKKRIYADLYGMGVIQEIDDDPEVGEIMVNGFVYPSFRSEIYYIKNGEKIKYDKSFKTFEEMYNVFSRAIAFSRKELNNVESAKVEAMRSNRDRVNIIIPDASETYIMNIRKFGNFVPDSSSMKKSGTVDESIEEMMQLLVKGKANIGIGGEMGTGKTTFINYLLTHTDPIERKVVISSVAETDIERVLKGHDVLSLNVDETKGFTFDSHMRSALRTTAGRIIIPESRGDEFRQVHEANLKTKGNMFTAHALDDESFLEMCVDMYLGDAQGDIHQVRNKIAKALDIIVIMQKAGDKIRIKSISEVLMDNGQYVGMNKLYFWKQDPEDYSKGFYERGERGFSKSLQIRLNEYGVPMSTLRKMERKGEK